MRKIFVLLISVMLVLVCAVSFSACSIADLAGVVDLVIGASQDKATNDGDGDVVFDTTSDSEYGEGVSIPVIEAPDPNPATEGVIFALNNDGTAYKVLGYAPYYVSSKLEVVPVDVYVPYSYRGLPVVEVAHDAFGDKDIKSVTLPWTLLKIGETAFRDCSVQTINMPASVVEIAADAFMGASKLSAINLEGEGKYSVVGNALVEDGVKIVRGLGDVVIGEEISEIGAYAFDGCSALTSIEVPATVTAIGQRAFTNCKALTSVVINAEIPALANNLFDGCSALESVSYPESVTEIGFAAFRSTGLKSYVIPASITDIGASAFEGCHLLSTVEFAGNNVKEIGGSAFESCIRLKSVVIPEGVTLIGGRAFAECASLSYLKLPETVQTLGGALLARCVKLRYLFVPKSVVNVGGYVAYGCGEDLMLFTDLGYEGTGWSGNWRVRYVSNGLMSGNPPAESFYLSIKFGIQFLKPDADGSCGSITTPAMNSSQSAGYIYNAFAAETLTITSDKENQKFEISVYGEDASVTSYTLSGAGELQPISLGAGDLVYVKVSVNNLQLDLAGKEIKEPASFSAVIAAAE
ncbi:MAG: leucine-rich repeat domain-containing protein [Clostridia bacterium]|nr:leucine-rich repeat domain-containing protein [Clostridia bacterium]